MIHQPGAGFIVQRRKSFKEEDQLKVIRNIIHRWYWLFFFLLLPQLFATCQESSGHYQARNHIIIVMDGVRYTEGWGEVNRSNIPKLATELAPRGVLFTNFYNSGTTKTIAGHTALVTGFYEDMINSGEENPGQPSLWQRWLQFSGELKDKTWLIASKGKLACLSDTKNPDWAGKFNPATNCGINGLGLQAGTGSKGYREDSETWLQIQNILKDHHPRIVLISLKAPDTFGPEKKWEEYIQAIRVTDEYVYKIWQLLQDDPFYRDQTAVYITNDHGRHLDGQAEGFLSHGDSCGGCQHVSLLAIGPDFKRGVVITDRYELIDVPVTIAGMLGMEIPGSKGRFMQILFPAKIN